MPVMDKKRIAAIIVGGKMKPDEGKDRASELKRGSLDNLSKMGENEDGDAAEIAASRLQDAVKNGSAADTLRAFKALFAILESEPHNEAEDDEDGEYGANE